jgi:hypothetical protein
MLGGDDVLPPQSIVAAMAKGDVHVLDRLEKEDRRKEKAARKLIKKLSRRRGGASHAVVKSPQFHSMSFASATSLICHDETIQAQRRLFKARDAEDKRAFFVGEISRAFDEPTCLVLAPRTTDASPDLVGRAATKDTNAQSKPSTAAVCVLEQHGDQPLKVGGKTGAAVYVRKLHLHNGLTVFYADLLPEGQPALSPPYALGLDRKTLADLQNLLARLLGFELKAPSL